MLVQVIKAWGVILLAALLAPALCATDEHELGYDLRAASGVPHGDRTSVAQPALVGILACRVVNNLPFVTARIGGSRPLRMIDDTGAGTTVIDRRVAAELRLKTAEGVDVLTQGGSTVGALSLGLLTLALVTDDRIALTTADALALDMNALSAGLGERIDGVLGYDLFRRFTVDFDYAGGRVGLYEPTADTPSSGGETLPLEFIDQTPFVTARVLPLQGDAVEGKFLIDTGATGAISLTSPFVRRHEMVKGSGKTIGITSGALVASGSRSLVGRLGELRIGSLRVRRPTVNLSQDEQGDLASDEYAGLIGGEVLRRYRVTIDYSRKQITLELTPAADDAYEATTSGLSLSASGEGLRAYTVRAVVEGSPATEAGIRIGD